MYVVYFYISGDLDPSCRDGVVCVYSTKPYINYPHGSEWMVPGTCDDE